MVYTPTNDWIVCSRSGKKMRVRGSESVEYAPRRWWWVEKWYFRAFSWCTSSRVFVCGKICLCECVACSDVYHRVTIHNTYYSMPHYVHKNNRTLAVRDRATEKECVDTDNNHVINVRVQGTQARHRIQGFVIVLRCACVKLHCMLYAIHSLLHTSQSTSKSASSFPNHTHTHVRNYGFWCGAIDAGDLLEWLKHLWCAQGHDVYSRTESQSVPLLAAYWHRSWPGQCNTNCDRVTNRQQSVFLCVSHSAMQYSSNERVDQGDGQQRTL